MTDDDRDTFDNMVYAAIAAGVTYTRAIVEVVRDDLRRIDADWARCLAKSEVLIRNVTSAIVRLQRDRKVTGGGNPLARWYLVGTEPKEPS